MLIFPFAMNLLACVAAPPVEEVEAATAAEVDIVAEIEDWRWQESRQEPVNEYNNCPSQIVGAKVMSRVLDALAVDENRTKFLYWDDRYGADVSGEEPHPDNAYVVYLYEGTRYTLWRNPPGVLHTEHGDILMEGHIAIWERPDGTHSLYHLDTYADNNFTGCINFSIGEEGRLGEVARPMRWNERHFDDERVENHDHWQERYRQAIVGLAVTLDVL